MPAIAHKLGPKMKTPSNIDADGFKRIDGKAIEGHVDWWKIRSIFSAEIKDAGDDLEIKVILKSAVTDREFGKPYEIDESIAWGEPIIDVTCIYKTKRGETTGYEVVGRGKVAKNEAVLMAKQGFLDNVVVVQRGSNTFLRTKPDSDPLNNLTV